MQPDVFTGPLLDDIATWGGAGTVVGFTVGYLYAQIYNYAVQPDEPQDPVYQAENGAGLVLSVVVPVILMGHFLTLLGVS